MSRKLGALVKSARTESGLTQAALAKKVKSLTASDISKIERGEKEPDTETLKELAKALGVTQTSLLNAASGKTTANTAKGSTKPKAASAAKSSAKTKAESGALKLSAAEKKLVQLYRKADADTKKTAVSLLEGTASAMDLLVSFVHTKTGSGAKSSSGLQDLLGSLMGENTQNAKEESPASEPSLLGSLLENLLSKK